MAVGGRISSYPRESVYFLPYTESLFIGIDLRTFGGDTDGTRAAACHAGARDGV